MADQCPKCHDTQTQPGLDRQFCLSCGAFFYVKDGKPTVTDDNEVLQEQYAGPWEPQVKPGGNVPVSSQPGSHPSAVQQAGAPPQAGLEGRPGFEVDPSPVDVPVVPVKTSPEAVLDGNQPATLPQVEQMAVAAKAVEERSGRLVDGTVFAAHQDQHGSDDPVTRTPVIDPDTGSQVKVDSQNPAEAQRVFDKAEQAEKPAKKAPAKKVAR